MTHGRAERIERSFRDVHDRVTEFLASADGAACREDVWAYEKGDGGGITRTWENSALIEKGGVNFSAIRGERLPDSARAQLRLETGVPFFATGVSLVIHPWSPHVPTIHMNIRYFEAGSHRWFGGGVDLTPCYPVREEVVAYHRALKTLCDACGEDYEVHKQACDAYFHIRHRGEARGVGGLFFDHLDEDLDRRHEFVLALGMAVPNLYQPFIQAHRKQAWSQAQREFQCYRRGRYVEFNLVYDRGTLFGLQSGGRIESILMSMPATAHWRYNWEPAPGSPEAELTEYFLKPRDWLNE